MANFEHERKFLVNNDDWRSSVIATESIKQAYIADLASGVIRVRLINDIGWISIKCRIDMTSAREFEYVIPQSDAEELMQLPGVIGRVFKTRHLINSGWIVDEFEDALSGLIVAEIELESPNSPFSRPTWLGKEVTSDTRYRNRQLAVSGLPNAGH